MQHVNREEIELYCFALHVARSWWGDNITKTSEHFIQIVIALPVLQELQKISK
jgi:hypothetical protein